MMFVCGRLAVCHCTLALGRYNGASAELLTLLLHLSFFLFSPQISVIMKLLHLSRSATMAQRGRKSDAVMHAFNKASAEFARCNLQIECLSI